MKFFVKIFNIFIFVSVLGSSSICLAQGKIKIYETKGKLISEANTSISIGEIKIVKYQVEVIDLLELLKLSRHKPPTKTAFRFSIITEKPLPEFTDFSIWLDSNKLATHKTEPNRISAILYADSLRNGSLKLALSKTEEKDLASRIVLPGTVFIPSEYATSEEELKAKEPIIKLSRVNGKHPFVRLTVKIPDIPCQMLSVPFIIKIDGKAYTNSCYGNNAFENIFTVEEFSQIRDGAEISIGRGQEKGIIAVVGTINKNSIE